MVNSQSGSSPLSNEAITSLWISVAAEAGWQVIRTTDAYASSDGAGRIFVGIDEVLDADDAPAQLIFHELCHALTQGPASWTQPDWGLSNTDARDVLAEHACLCVHVLLATPFGLRAAMAPTTEYRAYHDALDASAIAASAEGAAVRARAALALPGNAQLRDALVRGLAATRAALDETGVSPDKDGGPHPIGFAWGRQDRSCGTCAWFYRGGRGPAVGRCRQSARGEGDGQRIVCPGVVGRGRRLGGYCGGVRRVAHPDLPRSRPRSGSGARMVRLRSREGSRGPAAPAAALASSASFRKVVATLGHRTPG